MTRRFFDRPSARVSVGLHPDLTFDEGEVAALEKPANRGVRQRAGHELMQRASHDLLQRAGRDLLLRAGHDLLLRAGHDLLLRAGHDVHPDFDFDADFADVSDAYARFPSIQPDRLPQTVEPSVFARSVAADDDALPFERSYAHADIDLDFEPMSDPVDFAISMDDLAIEEDAALPDDDWDDYSDEASHGNSAQHIELIDLFEFDISDFEARGESSHPLPETPSARDHRLDAVAADLVLHLGGFPIAARRALHRRFRAILDEFPHHSSHRALQRFLDAGASLEELEEAARLRRLWLDQPWLWGQKRLVLRAWEVWRNPHQRLAFGWPSALRLVRAFGIVEAEQALGEDWFQTWIELQRPQASDLADEMAFFTYSEFLQQVSRPMLLALSDDVHNAPSDREARLEIRDGQGHLLWHFEPKLPQREGEFSLEPVRIRNHRRFDAAAFEESFGLGGLQSVTEAEVFEAGYARGYSYPEQLCDLRVGAKIELSSETGHGRAVIVAIDAKAMRATLCVPHDAKRLLAHRVALKGHAPAQPRPTPKPDVARAASSTTGKDTKA